MQRVIRELILILCEEFDSNPVEVMEGIIKGSAVALISILSVKPLCYATIWIGQVLGLV